MSDSILHDLCKGFGALLSRSRQGSFPEEASRLNERGNLPLHAACSFQCTADVAESLLKAYPGGASQPNTVGNLPLHQAAMWQAPVETIELLLARYPEGATVRNQYGSLPLHMAASNSASQEVIRLLIDAYPDALHLQNDDGMTPLDLALADSTNTGASVNEAIIAMLEGRPPPPELTKRQQAEKYEERAKALEKKLSGLQDAGGRHHSDLQVTLAAVRRLADRFPHALYAAGIDPNELEIAFSNAASPSGTTPDRNATAILLDTIRKRNTNMSGGHTRTGVPVAMQTSLYDHSNKGPRDRVEDLLSTIVSLEHIKSHVRGLRRTAEICDLRESLVPVRSGGARAGGGLPAIMSLLPPALAEETGRPQVCPMVFVGDPGTGKTAVARLLAKVYHELGLLRKPKFLEVERMDLVARNRETTVMKTREVIEEAKGGVLFIDEAYSLGMASRNKKTDTGNYAIAEIVRSMSPDNAPDSASNGGTPSVSSFSAENKPLIILAGFPLEMQSFLAFQPDLRKCFPLTFEFSDYSCIELARIFIDLATSKGFDFEDSVNEGSIAKCLEAETTVPWRSERNGRISEMLLSGVRTEVRKRMRAAQFEENDNFDPQLVIKSDIENVIRNDFK